MKDYVTDNLYVLDENDDQNSIRILEYIGNIIPHVNSMTHRYIRPYRLTKKQLQEEPIKQTLQARGVTSLPSLVVFKPYQEVLTGVVEIEAFYNMLLNKLHIQQQQQQHSASSAYDEYGSEMSAMDDTDGLVNQFYQGEITGKEQEKSENNDMSTQIRDRFRNVMTSRSGNKPGQPGRSPGGGMGSEEDGDNIDFNAAMQSRRKGGGIPNEGEGSVASIGNKQLAPSKTDGNGKDDPMDSVRKVCNSAGADKDIELAFYQNLLEDSSSL